MGFFVVGPPCGQQHLGEPPPGGVSKCLKICSKIHFLSQSRCVAGPRFWSQLLQIDAASLLGPPLRPATPRRLPPGRGAQMSQHLFKKTLFEPISVCCWPRLLVKIAPNRSFFTFGRPLPARNTSKVASGEGGPEVSKCMPEFTFGANLGVLLAQTFGEN